MSPPRSALAAWWTVPAAPPPVHAPAAGPAWTGPGGKCASVPPPGWNSKLPPPEWNTWFDVCSYSHPGSSITFRRTKSNFNVRRAGGRSFFHIIIAFSRWTGYTVFCQGSNSVRNWRRNIPCPSTQAPRPKRI